MEKYFKEEKQKLSDEQKQNFVCKNCESLSFQIVQLKESLKDMKKAKLDWKVFLANKDTPMIKVDLDIQSFQNQVLIKLSLLRLVINHPKRK